MDHTSRSFSFFHINLQLKFCVRLQNIFENVELLNYHWGGPCWIQFNGFDGNINHKSIREHLGENFSILHY